jgi:Ca-activated chloride channel family protein
VTFGQPLLLALLIAVPALLAAYLWQLRRRRRRAVRYSSLALVRLASGPSRTWRRHVPIGLVLASLTLLGLAAARPQVRAAVPISGTTVIIALDVSGSMCSTDVEPNRLSAAQDAVRAFVEAQPDEAKLGLVLFSGFSQLAVAPTTDRAEILAAIGGVTTGRGTTIGSAILTAIDAIAELDPNVARSDPVAAPDDEPWDPAAPAPDAQTDTQPVPGSVAPADPVPEIIVLLTDGANTRGVTPEQAARQAAERGVRVYPIGFGTTNPTRMACTREQYGGFEPGRRDFGGGGVGARRSFLIVDEEALQSVAETTGGAYFAARDADELTSVLADLPKHVTVQEQDLDLSAVFAGLAALLIVAGLGLSIRWNTLT